MDGATIFVYGSLCRGESAHHYLDEAEFRGEAWTLPSYTLLDLGSYPGLFAGGTTRVRGELYQVPGWLLVELDAYEGHPNEFLRASIGLESSPPAEGYLWQGGLRAGEILEFGDWRRRRRG